MRYLVFGAAGFVGRHIVAELLANGRDVVVSGRDRTALQRMFPDLPVLVFDLASPPADLAAQLHSVGVIVNVAGLLGGPALTAVHVDGPRALYAAARQAGVHRVVLVSAISARDDVDTPYSRTKLAGEAVLVESGIPSTILKPSLIVAKGSYGGTSVLRGLAGLPLISPIVAGPTADFSPLHARDLGRIVRRVAEDESFVGKTLAPAGPQNVTLTECVRAYRRWLGFGPAIEIPVPMWLMRTVCRLGDWVGGGPISTAGLGQLLVGNAGDGRAFASVNGIELRSLDAILREEPADVQDRWHARLFFPRIAIRVVLFATWLVSGVVGFISGAAMAEQFVAALGLPPAPVGALVVATSLLDLAIAAMFLIPAARRYLPAIQTLVVVGYTLALSAVMPDLWLDPFGALLKNVAVLALIGVDAALREQR